MNRKEKIENEISKTLDTFDIVDKLPHNPYFSRRLHVRMQEKPKERLVFATLRPILLSFLFIFNIVTAIFYFGGSSWNTQNINKHELVEIFAVDFNLNQDQIDLFNID